MRASSAARTTRGSPASGVKVPRSAKPSAASFASAASISPRGSASDSAIAPAVVGPSPSRRLAHDFDQRFVARPRRAPRIPPALRSAASAARREIARRIAAGARRRPRATCRPSRMERHRRSSSASRASARQARPAAASIRCTRATSSSVDEAEREQRVVQLVGVAGAGQASLLTRAIASASRRPRPAADSSSSQRRLITACVRRSSSGASSRNAYGRALRISSASGDGSVRSRATMRDLAGLDARAAGARAPRCPSPRPGSRAPSD